MADFVYILAAAFFLLAAAYFFHLYRAQKSALLRTVHLITALAERQYTRHGDGADAGVAGELTKAAQSLAENLRVRAAKSELDADHLFSLLAVLDHTNEIAVATDSNDLIRLANPAAARVLGRSSEQLLGQKLEEVITHPELLALYKSAFHSPRPVSAHITLQPSSTGGRSLHCQATAATIYNGPHYRGTLLLLRDITEIARTLQIKTDFVANASHELRTPLASILAAVETVKESPDSGAGAISPETTARCIDIIHNHSHRLEMIITDLLDLSRAEDPGGTFRHDAIDIQQVADQAIALYSAAAGEKRVQLVTELAEDAKTLYGDERLLHLTLKNLLDNATKFTTCGSITIRSCRGRSALPSPDFENAMSAVARANGNGGEPAAPLRDSLIVEVQDTGCGIPPEDQERVFERFYTVNRSRGGADRGTGLGLAIVKHAVAAMGGYVTLISEPGKGTTLRCHFPAEEPARNASAEG